MKTAIVHDYFYQNGGAEKVVEAIYKQFPDSDIYTAIFYPERFKDSKWLLDAFKKGKIKTSFAQKIVANKFGIRFFKHFTWLYPVAMSFVFVKNYDVVFINSTYCAKNVRIIGAKKILHFCQSPTRFLHGMVREVDMKLVHVILRVFASLTSWWLKILDVAAAKHLQRQGTLWYVNATHMKQVVRRVYNLEAEIFYPPADIQHFQAIPKKVDLEKPYYIYFGRIAFHKRLDVLIDACAQAKKRLYICGGAGLQVEMDNLLKQVATLDEIYPGTKDRIQFLGRLPDKQRDKYITGARGFLHAGEEDFGIAPIEALASGTPIIMYQAGGALDYLQEGVNGLFSPQQTPQSFVRTIKKFEKMSFDEKAVRATAEKFSTECFAKNLQKLVDA